MYYFLYSTYSGHAFIQKRGNGMTLLLPQPILNFTATCYKTLNQIYVSCKILTFFVAMSYLSAEEIRSLKIFVFSIKHYFIPYTALSMSLSTLSQYSIMCFFQYASSTHCLGTLINHSLHKYTVSIELILICYRYSNVLAYRWGTLDQRDDLLVEPRPLFQVKNVFATLFFKTFCVLNLISL